MKVLYILAEGILAGFVMIGIPVIAYFLKFGF